MDQPRRRPADPRPMAAKNQVTINRVAQEAGVSAQTVSRVINERPDVAPETRRRVLEVIARLGYRPNALARSLIHQRSHSIGVVAIAGDYFGPSRTLIGVEQQIRDLGYTLLLDLLHHPETENVEQIINRLLSRQVDGILWTVPEIGNNRSWLWPAALHPDVPIFFLSMAPRENLAVISIDNKLGGCLATEHLLEQGYRNIGIITGPLDWWEARQRKQGWIEALQTAGLSTQNRQVVEGDWSAASGQAGLQRLLETFPEIDALFASNDQMALGAMQMIHRLGRRIPEDLAIVGFDNISESAYFWPALTTVSQPLVELGRAAVQELSRMIDADQQNSLADTSKAILLQPELIVRQSSLRSLPLL